MQIIGYQNVVSGSPVAEVSFTQYIDNLNNYYFINFDSVVSSGTSSNAYFIIQVSSDGGSTWKTTNYVNNLLPSVTSGYVMGITYDAGTSLSFTTDGISILNNLYWGVGKPTVSGSSNSYGTLGGNPVISGQQISGVYSGSSLVVNALRLKISDGSNFSGNFYLYGN